MKKIIIDFTFRADVEVEEDWENQLLHLQNVLNNTEHSICVRSNKVKILDSWLEKIQIREMKKNE
jgi:hypothetical protein